MPTIGGQTIPRGEIRIPRNGDWWADVSTDSGTLLPVGSRVDLVVDGLTLSGAIVAGGISGDVGRYQVTGRPEWTAEVRPWAHRSSASVRLGTVLQDLARDVLGSSWASLFEVTLDGSRKLGNHVERIGASTAESVLARDALHTLRVPWYVRADGVTVVGERRSGNVANSAVYRIRERHTALGLRVVGTENPEAFVPGLTFDGDTIGEVVIRIDDSDYMLDVWSERSGFSTAVMAVMRRLAPDLWLRGVFTYRTVGAARPQANVEIPPQWWKYDLRAVSSRWLPDISACELWPGFAGHMAQVPAGTRVLVAFADADLTKPIIMGFEPAPGPSNSGKPTQAVQYSAKTLIRTDDFETISTGPAAIDAEGAVTIEGSTVSASTSGARVRVLADHVYVDPKLTIGADAGVPGPVALWTEEFEALLVAAATLTGVPYTPLSTRSNDTEST